MHRAALPMLAALTCACGSEPLPTSLRLVDHLEDGTLRDAGTGVARTVVFDSRAGSGADAWTPLVRTQTEATPEQRAAFVEGARFDADGSIAFGPERGSWTRVVEVSGPGTLVLRAELAIPLEDLDAATPIVRLGVGQLAGLPGDVDPVELANAALETTWSPLYRGPLETVRVDLEVSLGDDTRAVAITLGQRFDAGPRESAVRFERLQLLRPGFADYTALLGGDARLAAAEAPALGRFLVAQDTREGFALAPGATFALPVRLPSVPSRFRVRLGLPWHEDFALGAELEFEVALGSSRWSSTLATATAADARWVEVGGPVPADLAGRDATFEFAVRGAGDRPCVPVFATPTVEIDAESRVGPNVVLVSLDTLRADRVGAYGYERDTTPNLDAFAEEAWVFEDVWSASSYTLPAHMSLFSGQHPSFHGVQKEGDGPDAKRTSLLASLLRERGYRTAAFTGGGYLHPQFGFAPGFESYSTVERVWNRESARLREVLEELPGTNVALASEAGMGDVRSWLADHANESFLLFFHTYAPHEFDPPTSSLRALGIDGPGLSDDEPSLRQLGLSTQPPEYPVPEEDAARLDDLYDASVHQADVALGVVFDTLRELDLMDDTIVVVTSDHGKEIGEHGRVGHGHTLYEELLRIPLVAYFPGESPRRITEPAMLVDVFPTLLERLGVRAPHPVQGRSLFASGARPLYAEVDGLAVKAAWRRDSVKTIYSPLDAGAVFAPEHEFETYDLADDPGEQVRIERAPEREREVVEHRTELRRLGRALGGRGQGQQTSRSVSEQLEALGYTSGRD